jgi:DNA processing protein
VGEAPGIDGQQPSHVRGQVLPRLARDELPFWLALHRTPGVGPRLFQHLLTQFPSPSDLFALPPKARQQLQPLPKAARTFLAKPDWRTVEADLAWGEAEGHSILTLQDPRYPRLLREIPDPPPVLFVRGEVRYLAYPQIAMVGSRNPSPGGRQLAASFARQLAATGLGITSGLALGIDAASHGGALAGGGWTVAVAGTGPDRIYPARHRDLALKILEQGVIVTEFAPGTPPLAGNFPRRNRIISGLSLGTVVVEAAPQSGSLITARLAAEQGREVFAMPGSIHNPLARGCHALIRQGAKLVESCEDILEEVAPLAAVSLGGLAPAPPLAEAVEEAVPAELKTLYNHLGFEAATIDTLVERSGLTADVVSSMLLTLELQGCVTSTGGLYCRTHTE